MKNFSFSRLSLLLSLVALPCSAFVLFGMMVGGGLPYDTRGIIFWVLVLLYIIGIACLPVAWVKRNQNKILPIISFILLILPVLLTLPYWN
jgi:hypothetical protein